MLKINNTDLREQFTCPICSEKSKIIDKVKTINRDSDLVVTLRECYLCKHWWIDPTPEQNLLSSLYKNSSGFVVWPPNYKGTSQDDLTSGKIFKQLTSKITKQNFNFLEIGCGTGNLLKFFSTKATVAYGIEPGCWNTDSKLNIIENISLLPRNVKYDIIVLGDVLEHISSPIDIMKNISLLANEGVIIALNFPNKDCILAKILKGKWGMILPFGHLHFFSSKSIEHICKESGLEIITKKAIRAGDSSILDLIKKLNSFSSNKLICVLRLMVAITLGRDQWSVILTKIK